VSGLAAVEVSKDRIACTFRIFQSKILKLFPSLWNQKVYCHSILY